MALDASFVWVVAPGPVAHDRGVPIRVAVLAILATLLAGSVPASAAAPVEKTFEFSNVVNPATPFPDTFALATVGNATGTPVSLSAGVPVTWTATTPLAANASFTGGTFTFDLYFTAPSGKVLVAFGDYERDPVTQAWHFRALKTSALTTIGAVSRNLVGSAGIPVLPGAPGGAYVGHAAATIAGVSGVLLKGSYPAVQIVSDANNALYTQAATLGADSNSSVTVPMPELPAVALLGLGALVVGGVMVLRTRRGWT